ncbi:MAG: hypothetical protein ACOX5R_22340 [bacterium]|jgi:hypothetical protein
MRRFTWIPISIILLLPVLLPDSGYCQQDAVREKIRQTVQDFDSLRANMNEIKSFGKFGADVTRSLFDEVREDEVKNRIVMLLGVFGEDARDHTQFLFDLVLDKLGRQLNRHQFEQMMAAYDSLARVHPEQEDVYKFLVSSIEYDFWSEDTLPEIQDTNEPVTRELMRDVLRKKACNALGFVNNPDVITLLENQAKQEKVRGNRHLAYVFGWTANYVKENGSLKMYYLQNAVQ